MARVTNVLVNILIAALFVWTLQQGCVRDIPAGPPVGDDDPPPSGQTFTVPVILTPVVRLPGVLYESSGLALSLPGRFWSHNDSGNENKIYCFDLAGNLLKTITVANSTNVDWEDFALDDMKRLYICDAGNNDNNRRDLKIYRIPDPESVSGTSVTAEVISFTYDDQTSFPPPASLRHYDMEAVVWYSDSLFLFTKDRSNPLSGYTRMYKMPATPGTQTARYAGRFYLGTTTAEVRVTAADIDRANGKVVLLTARRLIVFSNYTGSRFFEGNITYHPFTSAPGQVEAVIFNGTDGYYLTEEGTTSSPGWIYRIDN
ncbi:MAG: hypothetical protein FJY11_10090 [Bacteroidetes bacterium]|nr:hypothetical protein [Bacteroidota bacterium]